MTVRARVLIACLMLSTGPALRATDWPFEIDSPGGTVRIYRPQVDSLRGDSLSARAAISVTARDATGPVFGAVWLDFHVLTDRPERTVRLLGAKVRRIRFPEGHDGEIGAVSAAVEEQFHRLGLTLPLEEVLESLDEAQKENQTAGEITLSPPRIIVKEHPAVLVLLDGEPVYVDVEGTSLRRVANTPFFIVQETGSGNLYVKGGDVWYTSREIAGPWAVTVNPPRDAVELAKKSQSEAQAGEEAGGSDLKPNNGSAPEIIESTIPAELIASDGPVRFSPIKDTGLLYASNTQSKLFLLFESQTYFLLISGRWFTARNVSGPWSSIASERLPADFARIPPGSESDDVLASVAGTVPANEAVLDAEIPQTAEVDRMQASSQVEYDGKPQFEPIQNTGMLYAVNASTPVILVAGRYYDCDRGVWFEGATPNGPWGVCIAVPPAIYTIPPRCPVYYVRYVRVYSATQEAACVGYTSGYTGCYVFGGTVVYGTGFYYRPWIRRYYFPRPWTWGFGVHYDPWTGWSLGYSTGWWPRGWLAYNEGGRVRDGWWGPAGYRPTYRQVSGPVYGEGYRPLYRPLIPVRSARRPADGASRSTEPVLTTTLYDRWATGVTRMTPGERPRQAVDMVSPQGRPRAGGKEIHAAPQGRTLRKTPGGKPQRERNGGKKGGDARGGRPAPKKEKPGMTEKSARR